MKNTEDKITIKDLARELGISVNAVSRALRDMPDISDETKAKVRAKAKEMGYKKNFLAASMRTKKSNTIGLIVPNITNPFFAEMYSGVERACREKEYSILLFTSYENNVYEKQAISNMVNYCVDGIIICPTLQNEDNIRLIEEFDIPFVLVGRDLTENAYSVFCSDRRGGYLACRALLDSGAEKLGYLTVPLNLPPPVDRLEGMRDCLREAGLPDDIKVIIGNSRETEAYAALSDLGDGDFDGIDGLFVFDDYLALGAIRKINENGRKVPDRISIIGYNDDYIDKLVSPELSSVSIFGEVLAYEGVNILFGLMNGDYCGPLKNEIEPKVVIRESIKKRK